LPGIGWHQLDDGPVDENLSGVLEVHGDPVADHRLDLPQSPVGPVGMAHELAGGEHGVSGFFGHAIVTIP
jgi:hypothetical protein